MRFLGQVPEVSETSEVSGAEARVTNFSFPSRKDKEMPHEIYASTSAARIAQRGGALRALSRPPPPPAGKGYGAGGVARNGSALRPAWEGRGGSAGARKRDAGTEEHRRTGREGEMRGASSRLRDEEKTFDKILGGWGGDLHTKDKKPTKDKEAGCGCNVM